MKKNLIAFVFISLALSACTANAPSVSNSNENLSSGSVEVSEQISVKEYSLADVALHSVKGDCWMVISGKVYDLSTSNSHPGGAAILEGCGKDATDLFETRPMGSGTPHSDNARKYLENYYVGELAK